MKAISKRRTNCSDVVTSPIEENQNFTSLFVGAAYRGDATNGSARFEVRKSELGNRYVGVLGAAREISDELSFAGAARYEDYENKDDPDERNLDARLGLAWRPRDAGLIIFDRLDFKTNSFSGDLASWKIVNNLAINAMLTDRWQISVNHGFKYSEFSAGADENYSGLTQLFGLEARYDITEIIDVGMRGSALWSMNGETLEYSYGALGWDQSGR